MRTTGTDPSRRTICGGASGADSDMDMAGPGRVVGREGSGREGEGSPGVARCGRGPRREGGSSTPEPEVPHLTWGVQTTSRNRRVSARSSTCAPRGASAEPHSKHPPCGALGARSFYEEEPGLPNGVRSGTIGVETPPMADVVLFVEDGCTFCAATRRYFRAKGVAVNEIDVSGNPEAREVVRRMTGSAMVPQIFISDVHVGGYEDLRRLDVTGELDKLLASAPRPRIETTMSLSI
ncbi:MAG: hypothetical protein EP330_15465 [Deltaproteobacteria bacterium]|nr:MAG: hypothetical protein EP330_15465 [Deltaproteobacteria bacterium]